MCTKGEQYLFKEEMKQIEFKLLMDFDDDISEYTESIADIIVELIPNMLEIGDDVFFINSIEIEKNEKEGNN